MILIPSNLHTKIYRVENISDALEAVGKYDYYVITMYNDEMGDLNETMFLSNDSSALVELVEYNKDALKNIGMVKETFWLKRAHE